MSMFRPLLLLRPTTTAALRPTTTTTTLRAYHPSLPTPPTPPPTSAIPDLPTFLHKIGRNTHVHLPKLGSWETFFLLTPAQLKDSGIEPARTRKYILSWREKYRAFYGAGNLRKKISVEVAGKGKEGKDGEGKGGKVMMRELEVREIKRGVKKDGGERRRKMVRAVRGTKEFGDEKRRREKEGLGEEEVVEDEVVW
ncbi:IGR protein motif-domain-containing protein [Peziza echinospora]|nr:IGR protein motif-domain-containing protein [Peziza echinospora]